MLRFSNRKLIQIHLPYCPSLTEEGQGAASSFWMQPFFDALKEHFTLFQPDDVWDSEEILDRFSLKRGDVVLIDENIEIVNPLRLKDAGVKLITFIWEVQIGDRVSQYSEHARFCDLLLVSKRRFVKSFQERGLNAHFFPFAVSEKLLEFRSKEIEYDIVYVGHSREEGFYRRRGEFLEILKSRFHVYNPTHLSYVDYIRETSKGRLNWNLDVFNVGSNRLFEGVFCGCHVTNVTEEIFTPEECVLYQGPVDMIAKVSHLLSHPDQTELLRRHGLSRILADHTYETARVNEFLRLVNSL